MMENEHIGSSFEDFLRDEGTYEETSALAVKRVIAWQLKQAMDEKRISKAAMARSMKSSRTQLDRILDPNYAGLQLDTLIKAARAVGREVRIELS